MKRRKFLQQLGYTVPASLAFTSLVYSCKKDDGGKDGIPSEKKFEDYKVVVVGAGAAGLYTAWFLKQRGFKVTVLEASGQIGGRIRPLSGFTDYDLELGAETIYGANTSWHDMVQNSGKTMMGTGGDFFAFKADSADPGEPPIKNLSDANGYGAFTQAMDFIQSAKNNVGEDISVESSFATTGLWEMFGVVNGLVGNRYGTNNIRLGLKGFAEEQMVKTAGEEAFRLKDATLLSVMEEKFSDVLDEVELNAQVKKIDYSGEMITVTDQLGRPYLADRVVVTVPLKILQDGDITFNPPLPSTKTDAFQKIGMGAGMKVHLKFSNPFWEDLHGSNFGTLIGSSQLPEVYVSSRERGGEAILTANIMGERAEQFAAMGSSAVSVMLSELDNVFTVANIASQSWVQGESHITDWSKEPFIRGAYSYPIVGGGLVFRKELAAPVSDSIFFAGEATNINGHSGTVHGAIESGVRVAEELEATIV